MKLLLVVIPFSFVFLPIGVSIVNEVLPSSCITESTVSSEIFVKLTFKTRTFETNVQSVSIYFSTLSFVDVCSTNLNKLTNPCKRHYEPRDSNFPLAIAFTSENSCFTVGRSTHKKMNIFKLFKKPQSFNLSGG